MTDPHRPETGVVVYVLVGIEGHSDGVYSDLHSAMMAAHDNYVSPVWLNTGVIYQVCPATWALIAVDGEQRNAYWQLINDGNVMCRIFRDVIDDHLARP